LGVSFDPVSAAAELAVLADAEVFVGFTSARHEFLDPDVVVELTGHRALAPSAALVTRERAMKLFVSPAWDAPRAGRHLGGRGVVVGTTDLGGTLAAELGASRVASAGLERLPAEFRSTLEGADIEIADVSADVYGRNRGKVDSELEAARRGVKLAEAAYEEFLDALKPGVPEHVPVARVADRITRGGGDDLFVLFTAARPGGRVRQPTSRPLELGDVVGIEISPSVSGQFVQICRTAILGGATDQQRVEHELLLRAYRAGLGAARPGATVAKVVAAIDAQLIGAGLGEFVRPPHIRARGHGHGLASASPGSLTFDNEIVLEEDMSFVLHPNQHLPAIGYVLCGDQVVVRPDGAEPLTLRGPELYEVAA
jgi:Xaa-Pro aminopeptidase